MRLFSRTKASSGYSLLEIMVCISLLAILIALLLPLLGRSRGISYRTQCAGNLKQFSTAFGLYASDWSGYWPAPGGLKGDWTYWSQTGSGGLNGYVKGKGLRSIWCCPIQTSWNGAYSPRTYSMNGYLRTPPDNEYQEGNTLLCGVNPDKIQLSCKTILLYEGAMQPKTTKNSGDYIYRCANWSFVKGFTKTGKKIEAWHGEYNNYLYCDGHIVVRKPGRTFGTDLSTGSEMYEWYVDKSYFMNVLWVKWSKYSSWN